MTQHPQGTPHGIGHNNGPAMDAGRSWRVHAWRRAKANMSRAQLSPATARRHVARAKELGLSYRDYAAIQASSGRDVCGFLFSSNALDLAYGRHRVSQPTAETLTAIRDAARIALVHAPLTPAQVAEANEMLDRVHRAPQFLTTFPKMREALAEAQGRLPANGLVVVGTGLEREWLAAGRFGAFLDAKLYFGT
ncbi:hypothetical protein SAMN05421762_2352 [Pseudooceanicola nitratireducens]|jgi:hypothetical protein|uniref:Uncharacterized protein n=1 Tax=Pseudooceanicola nitratireducens TaxID=517719 RepID=A0A1I1MCW0_9RHOB|nr:hypothetical protein [Pseudooceanicola nitratireducens]SEI88302.1 hypothetical protein SAMN05216183_101988 [Pseudooceanicola nitratireducens]SFC82956.1 hypothetical protein SAMN05421762_2352 [Pseudooceanicola nitratireducens]